MIKLLKDQSSWDGFVSKNYPHTFLQSWAWGDFNASLGSKVFRLGVYDKDSLEAVFLAIKTEAKRGSFLFVPHGPIVKATPPQPVSKISEIMLPFLIKKAREQNCHFIRVSPVFKNTPENKEVFKKLGFRPAPIHIHSERSLILDLSPSKEDLLKNMRKSTRNLLKKEEKYHVQVEKSSSLSKLDDFYALYEKTVGRQGFVGYDLTYLKDEFSAFDKIPGCSVRVYLASCQGEILSSAFIILYGQSGFYHHGASIRKHPKIPASHLLQWSIIKDLKKSGFSYYNFWGVAPKDQPDHPWRGLTIFKHGFGGFFEHYLHSQDYVLKLKYWFNWIVETGRRIKRGY